MEKQQKGQKKQKSAWVLVKSSELPVASGVEQLRVKWEGKQVRCFTPWKQWRRGKVLQVFNDGAVWVRIYQHGTPGIDIGIRREGIDVLLRLA